MTAKIIDASAAGAILFFEEGSEAVADRLGGAELIAPGLIRYELASICLKKIKHAPAARTQLIAALADADRLGIREVAVAASDALRIAEHYRLSAYDAAYLWLARSLGAELVTLDAKLGRAAAAP